MHHKSERVVLMLVSTLVTRDNDARKTNKVEVTAGVTSRFVLRAEAMTTIIC